MLSGTLFTAAYTSKIYHTSIFGSVCVNNHEHVSRVMIRSGTIFIKFELEVGRPTRSRFTLRHAVTWSEDEYYALLNAESCEWPLNQNIELLLYDVLYHMTFNWRRCRWDSRRRNRRSLSSTTSAVSWLQLDAICSVNISKRQILIIPLRKSLLQQLHYYLVDLTSESMCLVIGLMTSGIIHHNVV